jgi:hypothetical protein
VSVTKTMLKLSLRRKAGNTGENKLEGPDCVLPACSSCPALPMHVVHMSGAQPSRDGEVQGRVQWLCECAAATAQHAAALLSLLPVCPDSAGGSSSRRAATVVAASSSVQAAVIPYAAAKAYLAQHPLVSLECVCAIVCAVHLCSFAAWHR